MYEQCQMRVLRSVTVHMTCTGHMGFRRPYFMHKFLVLHCILHMICTGHMGFHRPHDMHRPHGILLASYRHVGNMWRCELGDFFVMGCVHIRKPHGIRQAVRDAWPVCPRMRCTSASLDFTKTVRHAFPFCVLSLMYVNFVVACIGRTLRER